jgi:hypothetical protein
MSDINSGDRTESAPWKERAAAARNPSPPASVLERAAEDKDYQVRAAAARNPHLPVPCAERLLGSRDAEVLSALARNKALPDRIRAGASLAAIAPAKKPAAHDVATALAAEAAAGADRDAGPALEMGF